MSMERLSVQSKTTPALFVSAKPNEIQGREGIRTIWPNLLDDRSNLANTFKKTLVQVTSLFLHAYTQISTLHI